MNKINQYFKIVFFILIYLFNQPVLSEENLTAEEVLSIIDGIRAPGNNFSFNLQVDQGVGGDDERQFTFSVKVKDSEKSLVTYTAPAISKGRKILMVGDNLWVYVPKTRMPLRISAQQKVSSGVSNADVARVVYSLDYQATNLMKEKMEGQDVHHISLNAKTKAAAYQRIELWASTADKRPLKADFYTKTGRQLKTILYKDYQLILDKQRPMLLEVTDFLNENQKIHMRYSDIQLAETPDIYFQKSYLPRLK